MIALFIALGVLTRLIPHYPNFTAIAAISIFAGFVAGNRTVALIIPFVTLFVSDLVLNNLIYTRLYPEFYSKFVFIYQGALWNYAAFGLIVLMGYYMFRKQITLPRVLFSSASASLLFYLVSNFGSWASTPIYPVSGSGLMACYVAGLPFLGWQLAGDLFYTMVLYGVLVYWYAPKLKGSIA